VTAEFIQVDVFAAEPFRGNPLAVFPDAGNLRTEQMSALAREMNLSETAFVTAIKNATYSVRIFTPAEELPFAGHPTIGTTWVLRDLGLITSDEVIQRSAAGDTRVWLEDELLWFMRPGLSDDDESLDPTALAQALQIDSDSLGADWDGRHLVPAYADAGLHQLMVPVATTEALVAIRVDTERLEALGLPGVYCFTPVTTQEIRARGMWPGFGITEDPATGSAAVALGVYFGDRIGEHSFRIVQGVEIGRESHIFVRAAPGSASVGGNCNLILTGRMNVLP
jgi:trans-2,3-dihydro-3-hydroxyanthranilate isomerase